MKLNVGAGALRLPGFTNVDVRGVGDDSRRGHAGDLSFADDLSVDVVFSHAVFEHIYPAHRLAVLREWRRVLAPDGVIVCLGLPNFEEIARCYLSGTPGTTGERFDLFEVFRYTHGHPEMMTVPGWSSFDPMKHEDAGPHGYVPQLHKGLFDRAHLSALLRAASLPGTLATYTYPGESLPINIGFVAGPGCDEDATAEAGLHRIGEVDRFVAGGTLKWHELEVALDRMVDEILRLEALRQPRMASRLVGAARRRIGRHG